jgi:hypothetical protein
MYVCIYVYTHTHLAEDHDGRESVNAHIAAQGVGVGVCAVDFDQANQGIIGMLVQDDAGSLVPHGLKLLAPVAPRSVEVDNQDLSMHRALKAV